MIDYLRTTQKAVIEPDDVYRYEAKLRYAKEVKAREPGERRPSLRHSTAYKVECMTSAMAAMETSPETDFRTCDVSLGLALGSLSQFQKWLLNGRLPEASAGLVSFFEDRKRTRFVRAAAASKATVARNNGKRNRV